MDDPRTLDNLSTGWVRLHRSLLRSSIWTMPLAWRILAITCLLSANHKPKKWWDGAENVIVPTGSFISSIRNLAKTIKITEKQVRGGFRALEVAQFISVTRTHRWSMVNICNWEVYQSGESSDGTATKSIKEPLEGTVRAQSGHSKGTVRALNKNEENEKNEEKEDLPAFGLTESGCESNGWKARFFKQEFWPIVWKKSDKLGAQKAFCKFATNLGKAEWLKQKAIEQGPAILADAQKRKNTPLYPASWINGRRYEDEWEQDESAKRPQSRLERTIQEAINGED